MLTIFTTCYPFVGERKRVQQNAILSWTHLTPRPEIFLTAAIRDEQETVRAFAKEHNLRFIDLEYHECGLPLYNRSFLKLCNEAQNDVVCIVVPDIIFLQSLMESIKILKQLRFQSWVATGRRCNLDLNIELDWDSPETEKMLYRLIAEKGVLESPSAGDYHVFTKNIDWSHIPPFIWGRTNTDTWINADVLERGIPLINITDDNTIIHPVHTRNMSPEFQKMYAEQNKINIDLAGHKSVGSDVATYYLSRGLIYPAPIYLKSIKVY